MLVSLIFKTALVLFLFFIIFNLSKALFLMSKGGEHNKSMSHFLGKRVIASALVLTLILIALFTGLIQPNPRPY
ncbi:DUF2909 domain-containing protein [Vibrio makurazakiensis]|uniref:DUF2909 domain-containing protein n=1 Tax=Vibrio makurazakiensis TaxID=2910250 RepID=UPI003D146F96